MTTEEKMADDWQEVCEMLEDRGHSPADVCRGALRIAADSYAFCFEVELDERQRIEKEVLQAFTFALQTYHDSRSA